MVNNRYAIDNLENDRVESDVELLFYVLADAEEPLDFVGLLSQDAPSVANLHHVPIFLLKFICNDAALTNLRCLACH